MSLAELSVIIPTYNNQKYLKTAVDSLLDSTNLKLEIIIVDDGSDSPELAAYLSKDRVFRLMKNISVIRNPENVGYVKAVNKGYQLTTAPFILLLNNDVFVPPLVPDKMLDIIKNNPRIGAVGPYSNYVTDEQLLNISYRDPAENPAELIAKIKPLDFNKPEFVQLVYLSGFCMMLSRKVLDAIKLGPDLYDEIYSPGYFEDCDLGEKIKQHGYSLALVRTAFVHHYGTKTFSVSERNLLWEKNNEIFKQRWFKN